MKQNEIFDCEECKDDIVETLQGLLDDPNSGVRRYMVKRPVNIEGRIYHPGAMLFFDHKKKKLIYTVEPVENIQPTM